MLELKRAMDGHLPSSIPFGEATILDGLASFRLGGAFDSPLLMDSAAEWTYRDDKNRLMVEHYARQAEAIPLQPSMPDLCAYIAAMYSTNAVPSLVRSPVDVVLGWREFLADSLENFRDEVFSIVTNMAGVQHLNPHDVETRVNEAMDSSYRDLQARVSGAPLLSKIKDHLPTWLASTTTATVSLATAGAPPSTVPLAIGAATIGEAVAIAFKAWQQDLKSHPLYWRIQLDR